MDLRWKHPEAVFYGRHMVAMITSLCSCFCKIYMLSNRCSCNYCQEQATWVHFLKVWWNLQNASANIRIDPHWSIHFLSNGRQLHASHLLLMKLTVSGVDKFLRRNLYFSISSIRSLKNRATSFLVKAVAPIRLVPSAFLMDKRFLFMDSLSQSLPASSRVSLKLGCVLSQFLFFSLS